MTDFRLVASDLKSPYGLAFDDEGDLFASETNAGRIIRLTGDHPGPFAESGGRPAGIAFDDSGDLFVAESGRHHLLLISQEETVEVFASQCSGKRFASPTELCFAPGGDILFSDRGKSGDDGCIYRADLDGEVTLIASSLASPAGMVLSDDAALLYVSEAGNDRIVTLEMDEDGALSNRETFVELKEAGGPGCLSFDAHGSLYVAQEGVVTVVDPDGNVQQSLSTTGGGRPAGMIFGGLEFNELYISDSVAGTVSSQPLEVSGQRPFAGPRSV
ncbi:MAG: SMP-30/gluconolactonase/LRE family protein [Candidatus Latescibacterota bacterium]|nr:SMP-30/gluconolactonase/LRE family protein [Candidatus Latescibacterota bacterium]